MSASHDSPTRPSQIRVLLVTHHFTPENVAPARRWHALIGRLSPLGFGFGVLTPPPHHATGELRDERPEHLPGSVSTGEHGERIVRTRFRAHSRGLISRTRDQLVAAMSAVPAGLICFRRRDLRPDVVLATVPGIPSMFAAWALAKAFRTPLVIEMRDAWPDLIAPSGMLGTVSRYGIRRALRELATRIAHRTISRLIHGADLVVTTTETFAIVLRSRGQRRVEVVRNGTVIDDDAAVCRPVDSGRPGVDRPLRAVYLGTMGRSQSLDAVVRAAQLVQERGHRIEVRLVGRGASVAELRELVAQTGAPVTIENAVSHDEALAMYRWADTAIVALHAWGPFEWTIPSKVYEVMARGVTVTAALSGEAADLVRDVGAGVVVPPDDPEALADLWTSWCEAGAVPPASPAAAEWVSKHATWDVLAQRYADILDSLVTS